MRLLILFICLPLFASDADKLRKSDEKRSDDLRKAQRIVNHITETWSQDCAARGQILSAKNQALGEWGCLPKPPEPVPAPKAEAPKPEAVKPEVH